MNPITMFVEWLQSLLDQAWQWIVDQIVIPPPPQWIVDAASATGQFLSSAGAMSHWVPIPVLIGVTVWAVVLVGAALTIRVIRIIASFATLGGGGA